MNKRIILLIGVLALAFVFTLNASFAASEDMWISSKHYDLNNCDKKIVTIKKVSYADENNYSYKDYSKINIKKSYQSKYKIKSAQVKYYDYYNERYYIKKYDAKNKNSITIKHLNNVDFVKMTIIYSTKSKIKNETTKFTEDSSFKRTAVFQGKKSNVKLTQKGNAYLISAISWSTVTYQKFIVTSKSKKYKIKAVKAFYTDMETGKEKSKTVKGYGKTRLTAKLYGTYEGQGITHFRVYYY